MPEDDPDCVHRLCYVEEPWAWFSSAPLDRQWGDDWNDAPYEHNAGTPYDWRDYMSERGIEPYTLVKVAFDGDFETPCSGEVNSRWSVQAINAGQVAWLRTSRWRSDVRPDAIHAGATLDEFRAFVQRNEGHVYGLNNDRTST